jgi:hypothetical protein
LRKRAERRGATIDDTAIGTTVVMKNERWVATSQPDSNK